MIGWQHAFGDVTPSVAESFPSSFTSFFVAGVPVGRDALVSETSLDYAVTSQITVGLSYASQLARKTSDNAVKGNLRVSF